MSDDDNRDIEGLRELMTEPTVLDAVSDNPYRFTVKVHHYTWKGEPWWLVCLHDDEGDNIWSSPALPTEAEANLHADLILRALREAGRE